MSSDNTPRTTGRHYHGDTMHDQAIECWDNHEAEAASPAASGDALRLPHTGDHYTVRNGKGWREDCRSCITEDVLREHGLTASPPLPDHSRSEEGLDVERLREAHRLAQVMDGDYMQNVATVYARLASGEGAE